MADNAKKSTDDAVEQKGRAEQEQTTTPNSETETPAAKTDDSAETTKKEETKPDETKNKSTEIAEITIEKSESADEDAEDANKKDETDNKANVEISIELPDKPESDSKVDNSDFQKEIREQIENCKFEIISALQENIHTELKEYTAKQIRKVERRRRTSNIIRDVLILFLAAVVGYFGYCLYDAQYFSFMKSNCEDTGTCLQDPNEPGTLVEAEIIKDTAWYQQNYGYLFDSLKINLNADQVNAYYLYSGDYKVSDIKLNYLLAMAYNRLDSNITYDSDKGIMVPANDLRTSYMNLFGNTNRFAKIDFTYDCADFTYDHDSDSFITPSMKCNSSANRKVIEEIDEIYEEGNVMYFLTTAAIYDQAEESFYTFDNLFRPAVKGVFGNELSKHKNLLNHYQYSFKKVNGNYYFSDIVKLD